MVELKKNQIAIKDLKESPRYKKLIDRKIPGTNNKKPIIGGITMKACPLHKGHHSLILTAKKYVDHINIYIGGSEQQQIHLLGYKNKGEPRMTLKEKYLSVFDTYSDDPNISVHLIDEGKLGIFGDWESPVWAEEVRAYNNNEAPDIIFSSEIGYGDFNDKFFPESIDCIVDPKRETISISGTDIRKNPYKHWDNIMPKFRKFFLKRILVVGVPSIGKTTLVQQLSKWYNTTYVRENGGDYFKERKMFDEIDHKSIYPEIAQITAYEIGEQGNKANRLLFVDTSAETTKVFYNLGIGSKANAYDKHVVNYLDSCIELSNFDMVILLEKPKENDYFVQDGSRTEVDEYDYDEHHRLLAAELNKYNCSIIRVPLKKIYGENKANYRYDYGERIETIISKIKYVLGIFIPDSSDHN